MVFVYEDRIESGKQFFNELKDDGIVPAVINVSVRFGHNNRRFIRNIIGKIKGE